jgi:hypothetical protein
MRTGAKWSGDRLAGRSASEEGAPAWARQRTPRRIYPGAAVAVFVALAYLGWFGIQQYRVRLFEAKLKESIGQDVGLVQTILAAEDESQKPPAQELLDLCEKSIQARAKLIALVRGIRRDSGSGSREELVLYLTAVNDFIRRKLDFYRRSRAQSSPGQHGEAGRGAVADPRRLQTSQRIGRDKLGGTQTQP